MFQAVGVDPEHILPNLGGSPVQQQAIQPNYVTPQYVGPQWAPDGSLNVYDSSNPNTSLFISGNGNYYKIPSGSVIDPAWQPNSPTSLEASVSAVTQKFSEEVGNWLKSPVASAPDSNSGTGSGNSSEIQMSTFPVTSVSDFLNGNTANGANGNGGLSNGQNPFDALDFIGSGTAGGNASGTASGNANGRVGLPSEVTGAFDKMSPASRPGTVPPPAAPSPSAPPAPGSQPNTGSVLPDLFANPSPATFSVEPGFYADNFGIEIGLNVNIGLDDFIPVFATSQSTSGNLLSLSDLSSSFGLPLLQTLYDVVTSNSDASSIFQAQSLSAADFSAPLTLPSQFAPMINFSFGGGGTNASLPFSGGTNGIYLGVGGNAEGGGPSTSGGMTTDPLILNLDGNGVKITPLSSSNMFLSVGGNAYSHQSAWAAAGNAVLFYDPTNSGKITNADQTNFTLWDPGATTDLQALAAVFDTNHTGTLDGSDANFANFKLMVTNADGTTSVETLAQAGITSINLTGNTTAVALPDGSSINAETTYTTSSGTTGQVAAATLAHDTRDYIMQQTITNTGSSTIIDNKELNPGGALAGEIVSTTTITATTHNVTTTYDTTGTGVISQTQTDNVTTTGGTSTEVLTDTNGAGIKLDQTTTTTVIGASGTVVTINRDTTGDGFINQQEIDSSTTSSGSSVQTEVLARNGSVITETLSTVNASGLSRTASTWIDGASGTGTLEATHSDIIVHSGSGTSATSSETVTDTAPSSALIDETLTVISGQSTTVSVDHTGALSSGTPVFDQVTQTSVGSNSSGSIITTQSVYNGAQTQLVSEQVSTVSANGLSTTTQIDANGATVSGAAVFNEIDTQSSSYDSAGDLTLTTIKANGAGTAYSEQVTLRNVDGVTGSSTLYADEGSGLILTQQETRTLNSSGGEVDNTINYAPNGTGVSAVSQTLISYSVDRLTETTQVDHSGTGTFDLTTQSVTTKAVGSSTVTVTDTSNNNTQLSQTVTTTTTNATSQSVVTSSNIDGKVDQTTTDTTVHNSDGSVTETVVTSANNTNFLGEQIISTSADRTMVSTKTFNADNQNTQIYTVFTAPSGQFSSADFQFDANGDVIGGSATVRSADGLRVAIYRDVTGQSVTVYGDTGFAFDNSTTDNTVLQTDGSRVETVTDYNANSAQIDQTVTITSANGLNITTTSNVDGQIDTTTTDNTVINSDGSKTETIQIVSNNSTLISETVTTTSANGQSSTVFTDSTGQTSSGAAVFNSSQADVTTLSTNGAQTRTVSSYAILNGVSTLVGQSTTTTSASGASSTVLTNASGQYINQQESVIIDALGETVDTVTTYAPGGAVTGAVVTTTSANGLVKTVQTYLNGSTTPTTAQNVTKVFNANGSTTTTTVNSQGSTVVSTTVETAAANGLSVTSQTYQGVLSTSTLVGSTIDSTGLGSDGSHSETIITLSANSGQLSQRLILSAADGLTTTTTDSNAHGQTTQVETVTTGGDGSVTTVVAHFDASVDVVGATKTVTSANGLSTTTYTDTTGQTAAVYAGSNNNLVFDRTTTDVRVLGADGGSTKTVTDLNASGAQIDQTVTTTSANGLLVTQTNSEDGKIDATSNDTTVLASDGSKIRTVQTLSTSGALISQTVTKTSANGMSVTAETTDFSNGTLDSDKIHSDVTVYGSSGSTIETVSDFIVNGGATLLDQTVTTTSANGNVTISRDSNGWYANQIETIVFDAAGNSSDTVTNSAYNGTELDQTTTIVSATGLSKTVESDLNGDGSFDKTQVTTTVIGADGSTSATTVTSDGNSVVGSTVQVVSPNGMSSTTQTYQGAVVGGTLLGTVSDVRTINADGSRSDVSSNTAANGTTINTQTKTVSSDGNSTTIDSNEYGGSQISQLETIVLQSNGSTIDTVTDYSSVGGVLSQTVKATAANGLSWTQSNTIYTASGIVKGSDTQSDTIVINANGGTTETFIDTPNAYYAANIDSHGTWFQDSTSSTRTVSANGLSVTMSATINNGDFVEKESQGATKTINTDGSTLENSVITGTVSQLWYMVYDYNSSYVGLISHASGTDGGYYIPVNNLYPLASGVIDYTGYAPTSSSTTRITIGDIKTVSTSADGLTTTTQVTASSGRAINVNDTVELGPTGGKTETLVLQNDNGLLFQNDITTTSTNGQTVTLQSMRNGVSTYYNHLESRTVDTAGETVDIAWDVNSASVTTDKVVTTKSANGLSITEQIYADDGSTLTETKTDTTTISSSGVKTEVIAIDNSNGSLRNQATIVTSADGTSVTTSYIVVGATNVVNETTQDITILNSNGGSTETVTARYAATGVQKSQTVTTTSANGAVVGSTATYTYGSAIAEVITNTTTDASGAISATTKDYGGASGTTLERSAISTTSNDGRVHTVQFYNSANALISTQYTVMTAGGSGSYEWSEVQSSGNTLLAEVGHSIDANGVDHIVVTTVVPRPIADYAYGYTKSLDTSQYVVVSENIDQSIEATDLAIIERLYSALLGRAMSSAEQQTCWKYYSASGLNLQAMATDIIKSAEFTGKYGSTVDSTTFVEQLYQNAYSRNASLSELESALTTLSTGGTNARANLANAIAQSAEHIANGNVYQVTNNTYNFTGTATLDHTIDLVAATNVVTGLYQAILSEAPTATGVSASIATYAANIVNGTLSVVGVANALLKSTAYTSAYGTLSVSHAVEQMFTDALGRFPTAAELVQWTGAINGGMASLADLAVAIVNSPDFLVAQSVAVTPVAISGTGMNWFENNAQLNVAASATGSVTGSGNLFIMQEKVNLSINGSNNAVSMGNSSTISVNGSANMVEAASSDVIYLTSGSGEIVVATSDAISLGSNVSAMVTGNADTITLGGGAQLTFGSGSTDTVSGTGVTFAVNDGDVITGSSDTISVAPGATVTLTGSGNVISVSDGDYITASKDIIALGTSQTVTITGSSDTVSLSDGDTISVASATISVAASATVTVIGNVNTISLTDGDYISATSDTLSVAASASVEIYGIADTISAGAGALITLDDSSTVTISTAGLTIALGDGDSVTASGDTLDAAVPITTTITGTSDTILNAYSETLTFTTAGTSDTIAGGNLSFGTTIVAKSGSKFTFGANASGDTIQGAGVTGTLSDGDYISATSDTLAVVANASVEIYGLADTITAGAGASIALDDSSTVTISTTGLSITMGNADTLTASSETILVSENGATLTITGKADTITLSAGGALTASSDTIIIGSNSNATITGKTNTISLSGGDYVSASSDTISVANGAAVEIYGVADIISGGAGTSVTLDASSTVTIATAGVTVFVGDGNNVTASGDTLDASAVLSATITGTGDTIANAYSETLNFVTAGTSETIAAGSNSYGATLIAKSGSYFNFGSGINGDVIQGAGVSATLSYGDSIVASSDTLIVAAGASVTVTGNADAITLNSGAQVTFGDSSTDTVAATGVSLAVGNGDVITASFDTIALNGASATITGTNNMITGGPGESVTLSSSAYETIGGNGVWVKAVAGDTVEATNATVAVAASASVTIGGTGDTISAGAGAAMTLDTGATVAIVTTGLTVTLGNDDSVTASSDSFNAAAPSMTTITGTADTITNAYSETLIFTTAGTSDTISAGSNSHDAVIVAQSGSFFTFGSSITNDTIQGAGVSATLANGDTITASSDTLTLAASATVTISGSSDTINLVAGDKVTASSDKITFLSGVSDTITGTNNTLVFGASFGKDTITSFVPSDYVQFAAADFASWSALQSHITQSGANTVITFNTSNTVTLVGVTASSLLSSQFHFA